MEDLILLSGFAFLAGLVDAVAGGGGLIQVPALFAFASGMPPATLLGTNKLSPARLRRCCVIVRPLLSTGRICAGRC